MTRLLFIKDPIDARPAGNGRNRKGEIFFRLRSGHSTVIVGEHCDMSFSTEFLLSVLGNHVFLFTNTQTGLFRLYSSNDIPSMDLSLTLSVVTGFSSVLVQNGTLTGLACQFLSNFPLTTSFAVVNAFHCDLFLHSGLRHIFVICPNLAHYLTFWISLLLYTIL